jgi:hypothetical protein
MAHNSALVPSVNCSLDDIDLNALKVSIFLPREKENLGLHS